MAKKYIGISWRDKLTNEEIRENWATNHWQHSYRTKNEDFAAGLDMDGSPAGSVHHNKRYTGSPGYKRGPG